MDSVKADNETELTSTMGNDLSMSSKDEKNDTSDATPTSSTDANTTPTASRIVSDDPISSTSSDIIEQNKSKSAEGNMQNSLEVCETAVDEPDKSSSAEHDADLLEMSISNVSSEKITEDVEDLVHDLESLLGESTDSFNIPIKRKEDIKSPNECEDEKSLDGKENINSPDDSEAKKLPDDKGDGKPVDQREILDRPQTSSEDVSEGIQEISSDETASEEATQDTETKVNEIILDDNIVSTQTDIPEVVQENRHGQTSETSIDEVNTASSAESSEPKNEDDKESNKKVNDRCPLSDKDQETSSNNEASEVECNSMSEAIEEKLDISNKENDGSVEQVENVGDSAVKEVTECVVTAKEEGNVEENKEDLGKQVRNDLVDTEEIVVKPETVAEKTEEDEETGAEKPEEVENKSKAIEAENSQEVKEENEVTSAVKNILSDSDNIQEFHMTSEDIPSGSKKEDTVEKVEKEPTAIVDIQCCDKDNEQFKEGEKIVEEPLKNESVPSCTKLGEIHSEEIEEEKDAQVIITEDVSEAPSLSDKSKTDKESVTQNEVVVAPDISDAEQCRDGCGEVDGPVIENQENKSLNKETEEQADRNSKLKEIPSQTEGQQIPESISEDVGEEINEPAKESVEGKKSDTGIDVAESESQANIPESTIEIVAEATEPKMESTESHSIPLEPPKQVIEDVQCPISPDTSKSTSIQPTDKSPTSNPAEMESTDEPSREIETAKSSIPNETTPKFFTGDKSHVSIECEDIDMISQSEQDNTEMVHTEVENMGETAMDTSEDIGPAENPKSSNPSEEIKHVETPKVIEQVENPKSPTPISEKIQHIENPKSLKSFEKVEQVENSPSSNPSEEIEGVENRISPNTSEEIMQAENPKSLKNSQEVEQVENPQSPNPSEEIEEVGNPKSPNTSEEIEQAGNPKSLKSPEEVEQVENPQSSNPSEEIEEVGNPKSQNTSEEIEQTENPISLKSSEVVEQVEKPQSTNPSEEIEEVGNPKSPNTSEEVEQADNPKSLKSSEEVNQVENPQSSNPSEETEQVGNPKSQNTSEEIEQAGNPKSLKSPEEVEQVENPQSSNPSEEIEKVGNPKSQNTSEEIEQTENPKSLKSSEVVEQVENPQSSNPSEEIEEVGNPKSSNTSEEIDQADNPKSLKRSDEIEQVEKPQSSNPSEETEQVGNPKSPNTSEEIEQVENPKSFKGSEEVEQVENPKSSNTFEEVEQVENPKSSNTFEEVEQVENPKSPNTFEEVEQVENPKSLNNSEEIEQVENPKPTNTSEEIEQVENPKSPNTSAEIEQVQSPKSLKSPEEMEQVENPKSTNISEDTGQDKNPKSPSIVPMESTEVESKETSTETLSAPVENTTEINLSESKAVAQPAEKSESSEDNEVVMQSETTEDKVVETEGQPLDKNFSDTPHEESSMETETLEATAQIVAEKVACSAAENGSVSIQTECVSEVVMLDPETDLENKTTISNELTHEIPTQSDESLKTKEETFNTSEKIPLLVRGSCETSIDICNSTDEPTKATKITSELSEENQHVSKPIEEDSKQPADSSNSIEDSPYPIAEASKPIEEQISEPGDLSKLENKSHQENAIEEMLPETKYNIKTVQHKITEDTNKPVGDGIIEIPEDVTEEKEESNSEEMLVESNQEDKADSEKVIEISDEDSKTAGGDPDSIQILSSSADSDSEEVVPVLVLEPDEDAPSPKEPIILDDTEVENVSGEVQSLDTEAVMEPLPEVEEILSDQGKVDETTDAIDTQENLETILAVANLQNIENTQVAVETSVEPELTEKERREMEALRKAVESITENTADDYEDDDDAVELIRAVPGEGIVMDAEIVDASAGLLQVAAPELEGEKLDPVEEIEKTESTMKLADSGESSSDDVAELRIEECIESIQVAEEDSADVTTFERKLDAEAEQDRQALPDTSEDKVIDTETRQFESKDVLPDSSQSVTLNEEGRQSESSRDKDTKTKSNERPKRHKKSSTTDNKLEELSINVDVPDKEKPYSPKVTIKPIKVPDEEVSTTSNSDTEVGKGSLKMTITKQSDKMHSILKICDPESSESGQEQEEPIPKLIIKPKMQQIEQQHSPKMSTRSSRQVYSPTSSTQRSGSPRITIKPVVKPEKGESVSPLKIKIKPDDTPKKHNPKVNIKPITKPDEDVARESVQSPRKVIIKPVVKPIEDPEQVNNPKITIKPIQKPEAEKESVSVSPRLNIKPIKRQEDDDSEVDRERSSPKITIKPVVKPQEPDTQTLEGDEEVKERIVLKINKGNLPTPTKDSKKREHPPDDDKSEKLAKITVKFSKGGGHPHIVQQSEESNKRALEEQSSPEKVKRQKTEIESPISTRSKHKESVIESPAAVETRSKHKEEPAENPTGESTKTKQKETEPVQETPRTKHKDPISESPIEPKRAKLKDTSPEVPTSESTRSRHKDTPGEVQVETKSKPNVSENPESNNTKSDDVKQIEPKLNSPVVSEDTRSQESGTCAIVDELKDPLSAIPVFEITAESAKAMLTKQETISSTPCTPPTPTPRKRGRPRKVPIVVREDFKEQEELSKTEAPKEDGQLAVPESGRPKRSCRGQSARATLGIKPRKPRGGGRGAGRGRGSKRGMGTRSVPMKPEGERKLSKAKLKLMQQTLEAELAFTAELAAKEKKPFKVLEGILASNVDIKPPPGVGSSDIPASPFTIFPVPSPQGLALSLATQPGASPKSTSSLLTAEVLDSTTGVPIVASTSGTESSELVMVDEETRMSADTNSRAQTPAKQVIPADGVIEESQSSVQSTATTESGKARPSKAPRLEVQEPEGAVISADQLTEYYWNGNGPFMLQEQVAQFLGIKSFKRKYPGIMRRMLEMQERDFIRESGLASEHMCDLGLTAVNSADILDIMYSDFQDKYEEYCKHQRDRQAKDLINKQKALSLAASQEKNKADITEQAVQSAAQWNANFNKTRKDQRKACMDLQTLTVHYPKGKIKQINKAKVGNFPVALVPGQFTDYYQDFTPTEINNLPLNTMCYDPINIPPEESDDSGSEGSNSDSDSSSSSSGSGSDSSSGVEDCKLCKHTPKKSAAAK